MRRLWKGLLVGSILGGLAYLALRRRPAWQRSVASAQRFSRRTARSLGRQWRDVQGAWRVGRRMMRRRRLFSGMRRLARRLLQP
ncbi:MAG: hypothetical protein QME79_01320 [Bacillota bacterium]|nr:hypothetical protein [Bacillota bacterium]